MNRRSVLTGNDSIDKLVKKMQLVSANYGGMHAWRAWVLTIYIYMGMYVYVLACEDDRSPTYTCSCVARPVSTFSTTKSLSVCISALGINAGSSMQKIEDLMSGPTSPLTASDGTTIPLNLPPPRT